MQLTDNRIQLTDEQVDLCNAISSRVVSDMEAMKKTSEEAVLQIGNLLGEIVKIATESNEKVSGAIRRFVPSEEPGEEHEPKETIADTIERQSEMIGELVNTVKACFDRQLALTRSASIASQHILEAAQETEALAARSKILSLNIHIEANRLGNEGAAFTVLSREIQEFSDDITLANKTIAKTIGAFSKDMPALEKETLEVGKTLLNFSSTFAKEMESIREETSQLTATLSSTLSQSEIYNEQIINNSNKTLSCLQFHDPLFQGLQRCQFDVKKLDKICSGKSDDDELQTKLQEDVERLERKETKSGNVLLFESGLPEHTP